MATCPRCGRYFDVQHQCAGLWRLRLGVLRATLVGGIAGALAGWMVLTVIFGTASWAAIGLSAIVGMVTARAALGGEPPTERRSR